MLEIKNIYKTFNAGTVNEKRALKGVNLTLEDGDFVTVIGGNGAGKSTLLNAIAGVWPVDEGEIIIDGKNVTKLPEHKRAAYLGRVFQDPMNGTAATMGIEENLALALRRGQTRMLRAGIKGSKREVYKRLLLLDEHTAALDPKTAAKVLETTEMIVNRDKLTTLMITHNMKDAIVHGNRLIMMMDGNIILDIRGEEKKHLTVEDLLHKFEEVSGEEFTNDKAILG